MRVMIACEFSGIVRDAFAARGHDAWSYDLEESERPGQHVKGDVSTLIDETSEWDLLIAFPPCTHLCVSGARWFKDKLEEQERAVEFFMALANAPIERIAIENPIGIMSTRWKTG